MMSGEKEFSNAGEAGTARDSVKILAVCLAEAHALGGQLEAALRPVANVELARENLPDNNSISSKLPALLSKLRFNLLLACVPPGGIGSSEILFEVIRKHNRDRSTLVILEAATPDELHRLIELGAADFCLAPLRIEDLLPRIRRWAMADAGAGAVAKQLETSLGLQQLVGRSDSFVETINKIPKLARCDASVFITGETGTGKEMCARAIHQLGPRAGRPFVPVNCGAIPLELVENELFGHHAGAFTGASSNVRGLVHDAEGGTIFLDEIDSLPLQTQVKLLRFLHDQEYRPLGARKTCQADVRVIAASNADLDGAVRSGRFRADLFYRLSILPLKLPALRERVEDIPLLARHFVAKYAREFSTKAREISRAALDKLLNYKWPGNVRELENIIERALVLTDHPMITGEDICLPGNPVSAREMSFKALKALAVAEFETTYVRQLLAAHNGNISKASRAAKKNRRAFWQLMRKHDIVPPTAMAWHERVGQKPAYSRTDLS